jgi:hypothetical protein
MRIIFLQIPGKKGKKVKVGADYRTVHPEVMQRARYCRCVYTYIGIIGPSCCVFLHPRCIFLAVNCKSCVYFFFLSFFHPFVCLFLLSFVLLLFFVFSLFLLSVRSFCLFDRSFVRSTFVVRRMPFVVRSFVFSVVRSSVPSALMYVRPSFVSSFM